MDNWKEDETDDEDPQQIDLDELGDDSADVMTCPFCGSEIYDQADRCNACGRWLIGGAARRRSVRIRWAMLVIVALMIASLLAWLLPVW